MNFSHSATDKYLTCGELYRLHYVERLRPTELSSSLIFGVALDEALNALLTKSGDPEEVFIKHLTYTKDLQGKEIYVPTHEDIAYLKNDYDAELVRDLLPGGLSEKQAANFLAWASLKTKGLLMLRDYRLKVAPEIDSVLSVQEQINLTNQDGDKFVGVVDLVANIRGYGPVILDHKTTSRPYKRDSVLESKQLATYMHAVGDKYGTRLAGYITMSKNVRKNRQKICTTCGHDGSNKQHKTCDARTEDGKRCNGSWDISIAPEIDFQIIINEIDQEFEDGILEVIDDVAANIKAGRFEKNESACHNMFGKKCPYFNLCHGGNKAGLVDLGKKLVDK